MLKNVMTDIAVALKGAFPSLPIYNEYVRQGFRRPCFCLRIKKAAMKRELNQRYLVTVTWGVCCYGEALQKNGERRLYEYYHQTAVKLYDAMVLEGYLTQEMEHEIVDDVLEFTLKHSFYVTKEEAVDNSKKMLNLTLEME